MITIHEESGPTVKTKRGEKNRRTSGRKQKLSDRVVEFVLTRNIGELAGLTVKSIASALDVNPSYLSRRFFMEKKIPLGEHIMQIKIHRSAFLLALKDSKQLTVKHLADRLGFCTTNYFINAFKKQFGIEPGKYRDYIKWENIFL